MTEQAPLHVRDELGDVLVVHCRHNGAGTKLALALPGLGGEDVARKGVAPLDLAGASLLEALGCAAIGLDLGHCSILLCCVLGRISIF